jgi:hypothetical protein
VERIGSELRGTAALALPYLGAKVKMVLRWGAKSSKAVSRNGNGLFSKDLPKINNTKV